MAAIVPWERLHPDALLYDLVYNPKRDAVPRQGRERGLRYSGGIGMLARQGAHALSLWLKVKPDIELMRTAAERALTLSK